MSKILKLELRKAFRSPYFSLSFLVSFVFVLISAYYMYQLFYGGYDKPAMLAIYEETGQLFEMIFEGKTVYTGWIGAEINSPVVMQFFFMLPLLAMLPSGMSLSNEMKSGYVKHIIPKCGRKNYIISKLAASFIAGGSIVALSLLSSVLIVSLFLPAVAPKVINNIYFPVLHGDVFSVTAYSKPMLFIFLYVLLDFIFGGLFACLPVAAAFITKKPINTILLSYLLVIMCSLLNSFLLYLSYIEISPIYLMRAVSFANRSRIEVVLAWYAIYALAAFPFSIFKGANYEII